MEWAITIFFYLVFDRGRTETESFRLDFIYF